jgi:hypothetical protein
MEIHTLLAGLIQVSRPQTYNKLTFRCVAHWHSYRMNYVLKSVKVSGFTQNTELQNSYQLDNRYMFCPGSSF